MKKLPWLLLLLMVSVSAQTAFAARLYKWVDEFGNVTYRDTPPEEAGVKFEEKNISGGVGAEGSSATAQAAAANAPVVLYGTPSCGPCNTARTYLNSRGIPFADKNVEGNVDLQKELKEKAGSLSVPTILVGAKVMRGYVQSLLAGELDAAGYPPAPEGGGGNATPSAKQEPENSSEEEPSAQQ